MPTIPQTITNGELSVPICANYNSRGTLFGGALAAPKSPVLIAMVTDSLSWMYDGGNYTTAELTSVANYDIWLMGKFGFQASEITGSGGSVSPIPSGGIPDPYDFEVSASSFIATGETTKTFPTAWQGLNILFIRNNIPQSTVSQGAGSYYSWDKTTRIFTLINGAAGVTELFQIYPII